ncbi:MAG: hypothetical protein WKF42_09330 [Solirubrobacteraceae bacterium]
MNGNRTRLACGADLHQLAEQVFEGAAPADSRHQRSCPQCQAALRRIRAVADDVQGLAAEPVAIPPGLLRSVMSRLRSAPALVTVDVHARGATMVAEDVFNEVARRAALSVEGVGYASVLASEPAASGMVGLRVRLVVVYGPSLPALAVAVRVAVQRDVARLTGATLDCVDVAIDDLA